MRGGPAGAVTEPLPGPRGRKLAEDGAGRWVAWPSSLSSILGDDPDRGVSVFTCQSAQPLEIPRQRRGERSMGAGVAVALIDPAATYGMPW